MQRLKYHMDRRQFLQIGALGTAAAGLSLADMPNLCAAPTGSAKHCIFLLLIGGPSQLDTWDLKPNAPSHVRGPFRSIRTTVPGMDICEHFPRTAKIAQKFSIVRSLHHQEAAIHETGLQLMQTGRVFSSATTYPHFGAVLSSQRARPASGLPPFVVLPRPLGNMGANTSNGQVAGFLGMDHEPFSPVANAPGSPVFELARELACLRDRYGRNPFGQNCMLARRLVERGVHCVTVNMFDTVFNQVTWDCHAAGGSLSSTLDDYRETLCPMFDAAYATLLCDLDDRGLLESTLVVAMGEFGRTPWINSCGGRDHWPGVWSILFAGGGVCGGQVIGSSDSLGAEPRDRPVAQAEVAATIYQALGVNKTGISIADALPISELF